MSTLSQQLGIRRRIDRTVSPLQHRQTVRLGEGRNGMTPNNIVEIAARVADKHKESGPNAAHQRRRLDCGLELRRVRGRGNRLDGDTVISTATPVARATLRLVAARIENGRYRQIKRLLSLIVVLTGRGYSIVELATHFGVSTKTVRRDLQALEAINIPVYNDVDDDADGGVQLLLWRVDKCWMKRFL